MPEEVTAEETNTGALSRPILVPLDGTDVSEGILPYVSQLAKGANVPLLLHGVVDPDTIYYPAPKEFPEPSQRLRPGVYFPVISDTQPPPPSASLGAVHRDQVETAALDRAEGTLRDIADRLRDEGVKTEIKATIGHPATEILRVAEQEECGLIAMSTHGRSPIGRAILGSVTDRVIHSSTLPVLAVTPEKAKMYEEKEGVALTSVMVALDGSEFAELALPYVEQLARSLPLEVLLVSAVAEENPSYIDDGQSGLRAVTGQLEEDASEYLDGVSERLRDKGMTVRTRVVRGSPAQALVSLAQDTPNDLVAMTTHGRSGVSRWMMGSVAEAMIRASGDPVLVVRPPTD